MERRDLIDRSADQRGKAGDDADDARKIRPGKSDASPGRRSHAGRWYLRTGNEDQTSLVIAEYDNRGQRVTNAELKEMPPKVSRHKRRRQADFYLTQIQSGKALPVSDLRVGLGIERDGRFLSDGRLQLTWSVYPGSLVGLTDTTGARIVKAVIDE